MRINHNIVALKTLHNMARSNKGLDKTMERLSSGLRINHAADDAAGLAITQKMDTQVRGLKQANRNANDGISLIQTAEGALNEVHSMLQRVRELAVQVSNGTYNAEDRKAVQDEVKQLQNEIQRISEHIEFNEKKLLNGDLDRRAFPNDEKVVGIVSTSDTVKPGKYTISITDEATKAKIAGTGTKTGAGTDIAGPTITSTHAGKISLNGEEVQIKAGDTAGVVFDKLRGLAETVGANLVSYADTGFPGTMTAEAFEFGKNQHLVFEQKEYGKEYSLEINTSNTGLLTGLGLGSYQGKKEEGIDAVATIDSASDFSSTATVFSEGNQIKVKDNDGFEIIFSVKEGSKGKTTNVNVLDAGPLALQIGANEGQFMEVKIQNLSPEALELDKMNLGTVQGAQKAITTVDNAIGKISSVRSKLGAYQNRLEHTINNLSSASENMTASLSRILDADMAFEMAEYTQKNIISQAGISMLTQANQRPQQILQLLQG